VSEYI